MAFNAGETTVVFPENTRSIFVDGNPAMAVVHHPNDVTSAEDLPPIPVEVGSRQRKGIG